MMIFSLGHSHTLSLSQSVNQSFPHVSERCITHKFRPNPSNCSFQKHKDTFNIASGFPEFAAIDPTLRDMNFCKNDTMFFRVKMDAPPNDLTGPDLFNYS